MFLAALLFVVLRPSPAFANCSNPTAGPGDQMYNAADNVMQYCNGTVWINMGTTLGVSTLTPNDFCTTDGTNVFCTIANPLTVPNGGTGAASFTANGILLGQGTGAFVTIGTAANSVLVSNGSGVPSFSASLPSGVIIGTSQISGVLSVPQGGTGENSLTANGVLYGNGTGAVLALTGTSGYLLQFNGASLAPTAVSSLSGTILGNIVSLPNLTSAGSLATVGTLTGGATGTGFTVNFGSSTLSGTVPVANGGTGQTTAQAARGSGSTNTVQGLNIEEMTIPASNGDTTYNILNTDRTVAVGTTALTNARTWYLPLGSTVNAGQTVCIVDKGGGVNSTDTLTVAGAQGSSDTVEPSSAATLKTQYGSACFASDGGNPAKWTSVGGGAGVPGGSDTQVQFNDQGAFQGSTNLVWNYTDGYLGVGTSSGMNTTLYVNGNTTTNMVHFSGAPGGSGESVQGTVGGSSGQVQYNNSGTFAGATNFVYSGGNVGIGTTALTLYDQVAEGRPLTVAASDSSTTEGGSAATLTISNINTTANNTSALAFASLTGSGNTNNFADAEIVSIHGVRTSGEYQTGQLAFLVSPSLNAAPTEQMRVTGSGVGIGYTNPGSALDVNGNVGIGTTAPTVPLEVYGTSATDIFHVQNGTNYFTVGVVNGSYAAVNSYIAGTGPLPLILQNAGGNVGIGTTGPQTALQVAGTIYSSSGGVEFPDGTTQTTSAPGQYQVACVAASSNGNINQCCQINTSNGAVTCKYNSGVSASWTAFTYAPFSASTTGSYSVSIGGGSTYNSVCQTNNKTGATACVYNTMATSTWSSYAANPY